MFKTVEEHVRKQIAPAALRAEFRQHEFEPMRPFCLLTICVSMASPPYCMPYRCCRCGAGRFNGRFGHDIGDEVLKRVASHQGSHGRL